MNRAEVEKKVDKALADLTEMGFIREIRPEEYQITEVGKLYLKLMEATENG